MAVATAFQFVARYFGMTLAAASAVDILLIVRAPAAVLVRPFVGIVSRFSFAHSSVAFIENRIVFVYLLFPFHCA